MGGNIKNSGKVKAVMFVQYTHGSWLAKQLREVEETRGKSRQKVECYTMPIKSMGGPGLCESKLSALCNQTENKEIWEPVVQQKEQCI